VSLESLLRSLTVLGLPDGRTNTLSWDSVARRKELDGQAVTFGAAIMGLKVNAMRGGTT